MPSLKSEEQKREKLAEQVVDRISTLAIASLGLVAALAWDDSVKSIFQLIFPQAQSNVIAKLIYAFVVTLIAVLVTLFLARSARAAKDKINHRK